uniref:phosphatase PAP2 family protein n=1 Tax=uncultured Draconibacterium sp. TaxID=1573823 RepID=UPI00321768EE
MIKTSRNLKLFLGLFLLTVYNNGFASQKEKESKLLSNSRPTAFYGFQTDSIHQFNFLYHNKKSGFKPFIAPTLLIAGGTALHLSTNFQENFQDWINKKSNYSGNMEDYIQYIPLVAVYALNAWNIKGKNNFGNRTAIIAKSYLLNALWVKSFKKITDTKRPNGKKYSFPSGHTSVAFAMAHFMHKEYGKITPWYSIGAYFSAASVATLRVIHNEHWVGDVVAGAGFGILSTELIYLTHLYKWDKAHLKHFDIFPFQTHKYKGLTLVYRF